MNLTKKQQRFVEAYIETGNATKAALMAGYSKKTAYSIGSENLKKPEINNALHRRMKEIEARKTATPEEIVQFLSQSMRGEIIEEVVAVEGCGEGCSSAVIVKKQIGAKDRLKAAELLLKRYPMKLDVEEHQLRNAKLKAEVQDLQTGNQADTVTFVFRRKEDMYGD